MRLEVLPVQRQLLARMRVGLGQRCTRRRTVCFWGLCRTIRREVFYEPGKGSDGLRGDARERRRGRVVQGGRDVEVVANLV